MNPMTQVEKAEIDALSEAVRQVHARELEEVRKHNQTMRDKLYELERPTIKRTIQKWCGYDLKTMHI